MLTDDSAPGGVLDGIGGLRGELGAVTTTAGTVATTGFYARVESVNFDQLMRAIQALRPEDLQLIHELQAGTGLRSINQAAYMRVRRALQSIGVDTSPAPPANRKEYLRERDRDRLYEQAKARNAELRRELKELRGKVQTMEATLAYIRNRLEAQNIDIFK